LIENEAVKHRVLRQAFLYDNQLYQLQIGEGMSTIDQLNHTIRNFTVDLMLVVVLISIFLDIGFVQLILRPFNRIINEKLRQMNHPTGYRPVSIKTNTYEFNYLDRSIDEMMQKVQESFRTEREFITNVSHELLTPVSILRNRVENILNDPNVPEEIQAKMVESQKTLSRLTRVVKALLYISKIDNDQYLRNEEADLQELMTDLVAELEDRVHEKDLRLVQEWVDPFVVRNCNRSLLHTLLLNLVSNAIKYNKPGGRISIRGWSGEQHYVLTIQDSGVGIREEQLPFIFDRFKRFRPEDGMSYGLGLPIVRSIAQIHDIDVDVQSEPEVGTTFTLRFPLV
jgi:signal transduction histidine kinase